MLVRLKTQGKRLLCIALSSELWHLHVLRASWIEVLQSRALRQPGKMAPWTWPCLKWKLGCSELDGFSYFTLFLIYGGEKNPIIPFKAALFQVNLLLCEVEIDFPALIALDALGSGRLSRIYFYFFFTCFAVRLKRTEVCSRWCPFSRTGELLSVFAIRKMYKILWKPQTAASRAVLHLSE